jgi:hypothetical protein
MKCAADASAMIKPSADTHGLSCTLLWIVEQLGVARISIATRRARRRRIGMTILHMTYTTTNDFIFPRVLLLVVTAGVGLVVLVILLVALFASGRSRSSDDNSAQSVERQQNPFGDPNARRWWERLGFHPFEKDEEECPDLYLLTVEIAKTLD